MAEIYSYTTREIYVHHTIDFNTDFIKPDMHNHRDYDQYEIYCFLRGKGSYIVENTRYPLSPGSIIITNRDEMHSHDIEENTVYERIAIQFSSKIVERFSMSEEILLPFENRENGTGNLYTTKDFPSVSSHTLLKEICNPVLTDEGDKYLALVSNLPALLYYIYRAYKTQHKQPTYKNNSDTVLELLDYINTNLYDDLSLSTLCDKMFISKSHLERMFREKTGSSVAQYIMSKRLMEAQRMIQSGVPITIVSEACGFKTYSTFYRAYKKYFGKNPADDV